MNDELHGEFGPLLKNAREKRGMSLQQVAATTKISARVLDALERNDPSKLPGGIFSRSFVRAYAREVGLDPEETVSQFVAAFPPEVDQLAPVIPSRTVDAEGFESSRRTAVTLFQIAGLSLLVVIVWLVYVSLRPAPSATTLPERDVISTPTPLPPAVSPPPVVTAETPLSVPPVALTATPGTATPGTATPGTATPGTATPGTATPGTAMPGTATPGTATPGTATPATATPSAALPTPMRAETPPASSTEAPLAVSIRATEACWLTLTADGAKVVARVLQPGERVAYQARTAIILSAGNAGALALTINGKPGKPLGGPGQVVTRTITVESLKDFFQ